MIIIQTSKATPDRKWDVYTASTMAKDGTKITFESIDRGAARDGCFLAAHNYNEQQQAKKEK